MNTALHFSSERQDWATPKAFFEKLDAGYHFTLDPCSTHANAKCAKHFTIEEDGLAQPWTGERVFMNPPYSREISKWLKKAVYEVREGRAECVVYLLPARTDTAWWHDYVIAHAFKIEFIRGRIKFEGAANSAPFPSAVAVFR